MKKIVLTCIGIGVIVAGAAVTYMHARNIKKNNGKDNEKKELSVQKKNQEIIGEHISYVEEKSKAATTILERHTVAAQIMRDILDEDDCNKNDSKHKVDFDEIDENLDKLLDEE